MHDLSFLGFKKTKPTDFETLYNRYGEMLFRVCYSMLKSKEDAEDAVQDVFLKYFTDPRSFNDEEHEKAWFIRVTSNHCKDVMRKRTVRSTVGLDEISELEDYGIEEEGGEVLNSIFALPEKYRTVFVLHYLEELSIADVAQGLGLSQSAVKMRLSRGRELLKTTLDEIS
jgi:RNA polymerase sigma-70 factor (ECF subfamily)